MQTAVIRSPQSLALKNRTHWRSRLFSILSTRWHGKNKNPKHNSLDRLGDRLLADAGPYRDCQIPNPQDRTHQQQVSPVPVPLLAMWMPRV